MGGHFELESGAHFKLELGGQYHWNLHYGAAITKIADQLLQKGMYTYVGSDVHHDNHVAAFKQKINLKDSTPLKEVIANNQFFKLG